MTVRKAAKGVVESAKKKKLKKYTIRKTGEVFNVACHTDIPRDKRLTGKTIIKSSKARAAKKRNKKKR